MSLRVRLRMNFDALADEMGLDRILLHGLVGHFLASERIILVLRCCTIVALPADGGGFIARRLVHEIPSFARVSARSFPSMPV